MDSVDMNVLHLIDWMGTDGGAEVLVLGSAEAIPANNYVAYFWSDKNFDPNAFPKIKFVQLKSCPGFFNLASNIIELRRICKKYKIDTIHAHLYWSILIARSLKRVYNIRLFTTIHNIQSLSSLSKNTLRVFERFVYPKGETTLCVSNAAKKDYQSIVPAANCHVLHDYIRDQFFSIQRQLPEPGKKRFGFVAVGSIKKQKNYEYLITLSVALKNISGYSFYIDVFGQGEELPEMQRMAKHHDVEVNFWGETKHFAEIIGSYDALVMFSHYEGFGIVLGEALAAHTPAFVSDLEVFKEVSGGHAIFINTASETDGVEKIRAFVEGKYDLDQMTADAYEFLLANYTREKYIINLLQYYKQN